MNKRTFLLTTLLLLTISISKASIEGTNKYVANVLISASKIQDPQTTVYRLFPTKNMWTFIKLNTRNGKMWQVQFDIEENNRFESYLNARPLVMPQEESNGRFTLHATDNIYTFILLDRLEGQTWQVQWSTDPLERVIIKIDEL